MRGFVVIRYEWGREMDLVVRRDGRLGAMYILWFSLSYICISNVDILSMNHFVCGFPCAHTTPA